MKEVEERSVEFIKKGDSVCMCQNRYKGKAQAVWEQAEPRKYRLSS